MTRRTAPAKKNFASLAPVGRVVRPVVTGLLPKSSAVFQQLFDIWPDLVAGTEGQGSLPEKLVFARNTQSDAVLHIWAGTGAQATEMSFNAAAFIAKINALFGYHLVRALRVTAFPKTLSSARKESALRSLPRAGMTSQSLDKALQGISNPALKTILAELGGVLETAPASCHTTKEDHHA